MQDVRIALDYTAAITQRAGVGRYTRELFRAYLGRPSRHERVLFHAGRQGCDALGARGHFRHTHLPLSPRVATAAWHHLRLPLPVDLLAGRADCFHSPDYALPPLLRARGVVTVHDLSFLVYPQFAEPRLRRYLSRVVPRAVARADLVLADSRHTRDDVVRLLGADPAKVAVVYSGVTPPFGLQPRPSLQGVAELDQARPFILTVGTIEPRKNLERLFEAYACLRAAGVNHQLVVVGRRGWLYEPILWRISALGLEGHVQLLEGVPDEQVANLYALCDVFVYPSLYEGFGLPPLEAMACGAPCVVSSASSLPEVVGEAALQVNPTDVAGLAAAMQRVIEDRALRQRLAQAGPAQAARFTWDRAAARLADLYEQVLAR